jgi:uncharacterized coiled-coil DUF342 family protein
MATSQERIGILETKVEGINEKIDTLKTDVKEMHDCLDKTRDDLSAKLDKMYEASCSQHAELNHKIERMEKFKDKWTYMAWGGLAVVGFLAGHIDKIQSIFN